MTMCCSATVQDLNTVGCMDTAQMDAIGAHLVAVEGSDWASKDPILVANLGNFASELCLSLDRATCNPLSA